MENFNPPMSTLWFWGFLGFSKALHLGNDIILGSLALPISRGRCLYSQYVLIVSQRKNCLGSGTCFWANDPEKFLDLNVSGILGGFPYFSPSFGVTSVADWKFCEQMISLGCFWQPVERWSFMLGSRWFLLKLTANHGQKWPLESTFPKKNWFHHPRARRCSPKKWTKSGPFEGQDSLDQIWLESAIVKKGSLFFS